MMTSKPTEISLRRAGERGAALVTSLLVAMLLLAAGGALVATAGMSASNSVDATAEAQAYYAAEAGLQAALTVVRRNRAGTGGLEANFHNFVCGSDAACTNDGDNLSKWLTYESSTGRVRLSTTPDLSYSVTVKDPSLASTATVAADYSPRYLHLQSVGRGPKGATKVLEMMVDNFPFDFTARAAIAIRSNDDDDTGMTAFTLGSSNPHEWTGNDLAGTATSLPAFVVTNTADYDAGDGIGSGTAQGMGEAAIGNDNENVSGQTLLEKMNPSDLEAWLRDADQARAFLTSMRAKAAAAGRLNPSDFGSDASPKFSFVDGDVNFNGSGDGGAGLLVLTGTYNQGGSSNFHGIVLALGDGVIARNGNPDVLGAVVAANFQHNFNTTTGSYTGTGGFGSPAIVTSGGGNSLVGYHSEHVRKAMDTLGSRVLGVVEK
jgi:type II secretory pathway pseudopilin PulG